MHLPVTDHHHPTPVVVDKMLHVVATENLLHCISTPGTWLHVHCAGGAGRTTTALTMLALLALRHEAAAVSRHSATRVLHRVAKVQYVLGGSWLLARPPSARLRAVRDVLQAAQEVESADLTQAHRRWSPEAALLALSRSMDRTDSSGRLHPAATRHEASAARYAFLHLFSQYVLNVSSGTITWANWLESHLQTVI